MLTYEEKIRKIANRLLRNNDVDMVIGFQKGSVPLTSRPCFITKVEETPLLVWDSNCRINLTNYLTGRKEKIAIVSKGCDSRNIVTHIIENKIKREQLYIIGVPCSGMIDKNKIEEISKGEILEVSEKNGRLKISSVGSPEITLEKENVLQANCISCSHQNPVISDELAGTEIKEKKHLSNSKINRLEEMSSKDRWEYFDDVFSDCIRCYACKNVCPLCYCPVCFVDESRPQWVGKGQNPIDIRSYHLLRAYHCTGRCTNCGACEQACPVGIDMRILTEKLGKDCKDLFNWEAGLSLKDRPVLDTYQENDPEDFIKK